MQEYRTFCHMYNFMSSQNTMARRFSVSNILDDNKMSVEDFDSYLSRIFSLYKRPNKAKTDVLQAITQYKKLNVEQENYAFDDGSSKKLVCLDGTVPVLGKSIPVCIWLMDSYPYSPPVCYVKFTSGMQIKAPKHIDGTGRVNVQYLVDWNSDSSNLLGLIRAMIAVFVEILPLTKLPTVDISALNVAGPSKAEPVKLLEILSKDLEKFLHSKEEADCLLKADDEKFHVHRAILSARSSIFAAMLRKGTCQEDRYVVVDVPDISATILSHVIYYIYTGKIRGLVADTAASMYSAANQYLLLDLEKVCLDFLSKNLTMRNIYEAAKLAHKHDIATLDSKVVKFVEERSAEVLECTEWNQFTKENPFIANKILSSALLSPRPKRKRKDDNFTTLH